MADLVQTEWQSQLQNDTNAVILDVRTLAEVEQGKIPGAIHIDIYKGQEFVNEIMKLDKTKNYFVYCKSGGRSGQACAFMNQSGFENAFNLIGGIMQWQGEISDN
jgi:rhodanese-related sulfurtransferase